MASREGTQGSMWWPSTYSIATMAYKSRFEAIVCLGYLGVFASYSDTVLTMIQDTIPALVCTYRIRLGHQTFVAFATNEDLAMEQTCLLFNKLATVAR